MAWEEGISPTCFVPCIYSRWFFCFWLINWDSAVWKQWAKVKQESSGKEGEGLDWSYMFSSWPCMQMSIEHTHKKNTKKLPATQASVFCYTLQYNLIIGLPFKNADSKIKALLQLRGGLCGWAVNTLKYEKSGPN